MDNPNTIYFNSRHGLHCWVYEDLFAKTQLESGERFPVVLDLAGQYCEAHATIPSFVEFVTFLVCAISGIPPYKTILITFSAKILSFWVRNWWIAYLVPILLVLMLYESFGRIRYVGPFISYLLTPILTFVFFRSFVITGIYIGSLLVTRGIEIVWAFVTRDEFHFANKYLVFASNAVNQKK
ncbi:hypothetical protein R80B4_00862 [Fibrobacteres bacterium R8-0-B4]